MRVVASLTTRPNYHCGLRKTLDSLTSQFDAVYLGLPYKSLKGIEYPEFSHPKVTVVRLEEDIGPASKLLAGLIKEKRDKNTLIVSVDDDHTYNQNLRKLFEKQREEDIKNNIDRVLTQAGVYIKYWNFGTYGLNGVGHDKDYTFDYKSNPELTTIAGVCGVGYPANIFKEIKDYIDFIKKYKNDKILFRNDDVLISAYISKLGFKKVRIKKTIEDFGTENNDKNKEKISPSLDEIYNCCYKLKDNFKNNNYKIYSLVIIDLIFLIVFILLFLLYKNIK